MLCGHLDTPECGWGKRVNQMYKKGLMSNCKCFWKQFHQSLTTCSSEQQTPPMCWRSGSQHRSGTQTAETPGRMQSSFCTHTLWQSCHPQMGAATELQTERISVKLHGNTTHANRTVQQILLWTVGLYLTLRHYPTWERIMSTGSDKHLHVCYSYFHTRNLGWQLSLYILTLSTIAWWVVLLSFPFWNM